MCVCVFVCVQIHTCLRRCVNSALNLGSVIFCLPSDLLSTMSTEMGGSTHFNDIELIKNKCYTQHNMPAVVGCTPCFIKWAYWTMHSLLALWDLTGPNPPNGTRTMTWCVCMCTSLWVHLFALYAMDLVVIKSWWVACGSCLFVNDV